MSRLSSFEFSLSPLGHLWGDRREHGPLLPGVWRVPPQRRSHRGALQHDGGAIRPGGHRIRPGISSKKIYGVEDCLFVCITNSQQKKCTVCDTFKLWDMAWCIFATWSVRCWGLKGGYSQIFWAHWALGAESGCVAGVVMVLATDRLVGCKMCPGNGDQPGGNPQSYRPSLILPDISVFYKACCRS